MIQEALIRRPLFVLAIAFSCGLIFSRYCSLPLWLLAGTAILFLVLILLRPFNWLWLALIFTLGMVRMEWSRTILNSDLRYLQFNPDSTYRFSGIVSSVGESSTGKQRLAIEIISLRDSIPGQGQVWSYLSDPLPVLPGDTLSGEAFFRKPHPRANPMDFDFRHYLAEHQVSWLLYPPRSHPLKVDSLTGHSFVRSISYLREFIAGYIRANIPGQSGILLTALLLGQRGAVDDEIIQWFSDTGVIHVLAVSGLHVGYVTLILFVILGFVRLPYRMQVYGTIIGLAFYAILTGGAPSVLRAGTMAALVLWGTTLERRVDLYNILGAAGLGMLILVPSQLWRVGFQLSFAAVFSIAYFYPRLKAIIPKPIAQFLLDHPWVGYFIDLLIVSLAAQMGTLPFTLYYFHKMPLMGLLANLVVIPTVGIVVALGFARLILGSWVPLVGSWWSALIQLLLELLVKFVQWLHGIPGAYYQVPPIPLHWLAVTGLMFLVAFSSFRRKWFYLLVLVLGCFNWAVWRETLSSQPVLSVAFLNVGQGDGAVIETPAHRVIVIDCGLQFKGKDMGAKVIGPYLNRIGADTIDLMILTHPHNDHIGGAPWLLRHFTVKRIWQPKFDYKSYVYSEIQRLVDSLKVESLQPFAGEIDSSFWPVVIRVLAPDSSIVTHPPSVTNNVSIVTQILYGQTSFLLTGDAENYSEERQTVFSSILKSDVIKAPHHGSITSSLPDYVNLVDPLWVVISVGLRNKFHHPAPVTLARYSKLGVKIKRTDLDQAVIMKSDGDTVIVMNWQAKGSGY